MTHVLTSSRLGWLSPPQYAWSQYAPYLSWVQTDPLYAAGASAAGIKPYSYTNPNRQMAGQNMWTNDESTFAHDCSGSRIYNLGIPQLKLMQPSSSNLDNLWLSVSQQMMSQKGFAAIFEDDTSDVYGVNALPCGYDPNAWLAASLAETALLTNNSVPVIYNGLSLLGPGPSISPVIAMNAYATGGMMENCYIRPGTSNNYTNGLGWAVVEDTEITMAQQGKFFFCYANDYNVYANQAVALRKYAFASFLLSYNRWTSVYETNFANLNDFNVMPESQLVALNPLTLTPQSANDLLTSTGVYGREYDECYLRGQYVGKCAAVVNADPFQSHTFPYSGYTRTMTISGNGPLAGGTVSVNGPAPPGTMGTLTAVIAFK